MDLPKGYIARDSEPEILKVWEKSGYANPDKLPNAEKRKPYAIAMPPFNTTAILHIGHAVLLAIQDLLIRFERMRGKRTLWLPGTDHAAIATQNMVEKELKKEGKRRQDLGRDAFLKSVDDYVAKSQVTIKRQVRSMGASCDWSRERFTLDAGLSKAVAEAFTRLYDAGLIYRGNRIVNWCPRDRSTLADDEVEYVEKETPFYYFRYGPVVIGTARPETKFGDKVIVVHPDDKRYKNLVGKTMTVDWILGPIEARVIADPAADPELGSGAMTITPAHSFMDFELAKKYGIDIQKIIDEDGRLTDAAGPMTGMPVKEAREKVVAILKEKGLLERIDENYVHNLSVCYRCGTAVEPLPSEQWFVAVEKPVKFPDGRTQTLKERSLEVVKQGEIQIIPKQFEKTYFHWMENLHDWCISRQIWYGHRVPVWRKGKELHVAAVPPKGEGWEQDPDTLDTWFSSGLWTFSTLGWPEKTNDLKTYHPTNVLETAYDILFFWVARMILMSTYLVGEIPFKTVYLHGLVRDKQGRKMSKSLGNGIDPTEMAEKYGADAVRLSLIIGTSPGNDQRLAEDKIAGFRNYANKIWNIGRFVLLNPPTPPLNAKGGLADRWIVSRLNRLIEETTDHLERFEFSQAGEKLYDFAWHEFADWYLEIAKVEGNHALAREVFETVLKLLHPFMPFVTEALWSHLNGDPPDSPRGGRGRDLLMIQEWPKADRKVIDEKAEAEFKKLQERVVTLRIQRKAAGLTGKTPLEVKATPFDREHQAIIERLAMVRF